MGLFASSHALQHQHHTGVTYNFSFFIFITFFLGILNPLLAGADKNDSADKVAEKLEELSVKEESKEPEKKEAKEETEEKQ